MSSYYHYNTHQHPTSANAQSATSTHHGGRGRRAPRLSQNPHKQFRSVRKDEEAIAVTNFRQRFEAGRSFDLDDDMEFCPNLLTENDMFSLHSSSSDRSSLSSGSPESSPQSHQVAPDSGFSLNSNSNPYIPSYQSQPTTLKLHQPAATRIRNAIPIVNPSTGIRMSSSPSIGTVARQDAAKINQLADVGKTAMRMFSPLHVQSSIVAMIVFVFLFLSWRVLHFGIGHPLTSTNSCTNFKNSPSMFFETATT